MVDKIQVISTALKFIELAYAYSVKYLSKAITQISIQLPGGED
jgi:hypothetical protein